MDGLSFAEVASTVWAISLGFQSTFQLVLLQGQATQAALQRASRNGPIIALNVATLLFFELDRLRRAASTHGRPPFVPEQRLLDASFAMHLGLMGNSPIKVCC